ncbi:MAG: hypothetical protein RIF46_08510 [Cyclobacteriaceae bacterium]
MKSILLFLSLCALLSCVSQKSNSQNGFLEGITGLFEGNCMPAPGQEPCKPKPISTLVYVTKPSEKFNQELLVTTILSKEDGSFKVDLAPGKYSLFLKDGDEKICDGLNCDGDDCYCTLVEIKKDSTTSVKVNIDHATW